jgi:TetR/AcrR family transcriptional regulator, repressor for uid operon
MRGMTDRQGGEPSRDRLLRAAYDLLLTDGYLAATVGAVARRARLTTGAVYSNFVNKHEMLVEAVLGHWSRSPRAAPLHLYGDRDERDVRSDLDRLAEALAAHLAAPPQPEHRLMTEVTGTAIRDADAEGVLRGGLERIMAFAGRAIDEAKADGVVDPHLSTEALVTVVVSLYLGAITTKSFGLDQPDLGGVRELLSSLTATHGK